MITLLTVSSDLHVLFFLRCSSTTSAACPIVSRPCLVEALSDCGIRSFSQGRWSPTRRGGGVARGFVDEFRSLPGGASASQLLLTMYVGCVRRVATSVAKSVVQRRCPSSLRPKSRVESRCGVPRLVPGSGEPRVPRVGRMCKGPKGQRRVGGEAFAFKSLEVTTSCPYRHFCSWIS